MAEELEQARCKKEATQLVTTLLEAPKPKKPVIVTSGLMEQQPEKVVQCWACGEIGHTNKSPNCSMKKEGGSRKAKVKVETSKTNEKAGGKEKKTISCSHCKKQRHCHENYFILHPEKRQSSSATESAAVKAL